MENTLVGNSKGGIYECAIADALYKKGYPLYFYKNETHNTANTDGNGIGTLDNLVWGWAMIVLLLGTHIFLTIRTKFIQYKTRQQKKKSIL